MKKIINRKKNTKSITLVFISLVVAVVLSTQLLVKQADAGCNTKESCQAQITSLENDVAAYQAEAASLNSKAITLNIALSQITNQKSALQAQIDINQAKYDQLVIQIADTEQKIKDNQAALGETIANMYVADQITPLEMLASSKNIGDYLDKQEYRSSVRSELTTTITKIKELKKSLDEQKAQGEKILNDQKNQRDALAVKENEQQKLIDTTKGNEATYQGLIADNIAQINEARAIQAAIGNRSNSTGGYVLVDSGSIGDYKWNNSNCPMGAWYQGLWMPFFSNEGSDGDGHDGGADGIGSDGYGCRQCASYVAWKIAKETGSYPYWGNAIDFTANAKGAPFYGTEGEPHRGSIAVLDAGGFGHVAWVESEPYINDKGQKVILVSQYNFDYGAGYGMYSMMELSVNFFDHYVQIKKY